jgi:hypothetical protein
MARAAPESTGDEIWYNDAVTLLAERCGGAADFAEQLLVKGLADDLVPWSHMRKDGTRVRGDDAFWKHKRHLLVINQAENRAHYAPLIATADLSDVPESVFAIKVSRAAVLRLVPGSKRKPGPGVEPTYDHAAFIAAANRVLERGKPDTKTLFYEKVRDELRGKTKLPPEDDDSTLRRVVGPLWEAAG